MAAGLEVGGWSGPSRRRVPRFRMLAPLEVTVLRSGIPDTLPGRALNMCERGIGVILAGDLKSGESVGVEVRLSPAAQPLRTRATVRHHDKLRYGLEFTALSAEQRNAIRNWAKGIRENAEAKESATLLTSNEESRSDSLRRANVALSGRDPRGRRKRLAQAGLTAGVLIVVCSAVLWWRWNRSWQELESGLKNPEAASTAKPQAQVSADVMQKLLIHRVEPVYPPEARKRRLQGVIALKVIVGRDGSVLSMRALNGPEILAQAAMDALRWWKFEPYRLNGQAAIVETTLAVEFKR